MSNIAAQSSAGLLDHHLDAIGSVFDDEFQGEFTE